MKPRSSPQHGPLFIAHSTAALHDWLLVNRDGRTARVNRMGEITRTRLRLCRS